MDMIGKYRLAVKMDILAHGNFIDKKNASEI